MHVDSDDLSGYPLLTQTRRFREQARERTKQQKRALESRRKIRPESDKRATGEEAESNKRRVGERPPAGEQPESDQRATGERPESDQRATRDVALLLDLHDKLHSLEPAWLKPSRLRAWPLSRPLCTQSRLV